MTLPRSAHRDQYDIMVQNFGDCLLEEQVIEGISWRVPQQLRSSAHKEQPMVPRSSGAILAGDPAREVFGTVL